MAECPAKAGTSGTPFIEGGDLYAESAGYRFGLKAYYYRKKSAAFMNSELDES